MKIIVTGGAGFVGSHLVEKLYDSGHNVIVIDNLSTGKKENLKRFIDGKVTENFCFIKADLSVFHIWDEYPGILDGTEVIIHLAALPRVGRSVENPVETHLSNVNGTLQALELARRLKVKRFLFASSSSVYGNQESLPLTESMVPNPQNPYACQKQIGENYLDIYAKVYGLESIAFRFFNVYGPRMAFEGAYKLVFANWIEQIRDAKPITIYGKGEQTRDFTHVEDICDGIISGLNVPIPNKFEIINLGTGIQTSVKNLAELFEAESVEIEARENEEMYKVASRTKAQELLGWVPKREIAWGVGQLRGLYLNGN